MSTIGAKQQGKLNYWIIGQRLPGTGETIFQKLTIHWQKHYSTTCRYSLIQYTLFRDRIPFERCFKAQTLQHNPNHPMSTIGAKQQGKLNNWIIRQRLPGTGETIFEKLTIHWQIHYSTTCRYSLFQYTISKENIATRRPKQSRHIMPLLILLL